MNSRKKSNPQPIQSKPKDDDNDDIFDAELSPLSPGATQESEQNVENVITCSLTPSTEESADATEEADLPEYPPKQLNLN